MVNVKKKPAATPAEVIAARGHRTQVQVAEMLGVSRATIQNWESGRRPIPKVAYQALLALA
jgi:DNA-binding transcriptional regulator YiaG